MALGALLVAVAVAVAPVTLCGALAFLVAWLCGWPPRRLYLAAAWCLPMVAAWLTALALGMPGPSPWQLLTHGRLAALFVAVAPVTVPLGLLLGGLAWARRLFAMQAGAAGYSPAASPAFDRRQWRRQVRTARARLAAPGALPLLNRDGDIVVGAIIRTVRHPARAVAGLPYERLRSHQVVIGTSGTGKTTLLLRLWAGFMAAGVRRR